MIITSTFDLHSVSFYITSGIFLGSQDDDIDLVKQFGHITVNVLKANIVDEKVDSMLINFCHC